VTKVISVAEALRQVGVTRLAHFTPSKNLPHIVRDGTIRSSKDLAENAPEYFSPTDRQRFDRHPDKVCGSFEYPNGYYLAKARDKSEYLNYPDWVCLLLDIHLAERPGTLFSPGNAATGSGAYLQAGGQAVLACYAPRVGQWSRGRWHHPRAATDLQAEVLVPGPIELSYLRRIMVPSAEAACNEYGRLETLGVNCDGLQWGIAPVFFDRDLLSSRLRFGGIIDENDWMPPSAGGGST
jgi:ssDNA thymidine ADP-ribosyltransferase, DarT